MRILIKRKKKVLSSTHRESSDLEDLRGQQATAEEEKPLEEVDQEVTEADQVSEFQHDQEEEEEPSFASVADLATTDHHTLELLFVVEHQLQPSAILTTSAEVDAAQETEG